MTVPLAAIRKLSPEQRFTYYLLAHIFNELMCLQKLVSFALPKHEDVRPARLRPEIGQALFLFRLASGKIWEAINAIRSKEIANTLLKDVLPRMQEGDSRLKELNAAVNNAQWLSPLRNGMGFHFPKFEHWIKHIAPDETWVDDTVFMGDKSGNTWYDAADTIAQGWMFEQYGAAEVRSAVDPLLNQMIDLLRTMNSFLDDALGVFIAEVILEGNVARRSVGKVLAPRFERFSIPFWTAMPSRSS